MERPRATEGAVAQRETVECSWRVDQGSSLGDLAPGLEGERFRNLDVVHLEVLTYRNGSPHDRVGDEPNREVVRVTGDLDRLAA